METKKNHFEKFATDQSKQIQSLKQKMKQNMKQKIFFSQTWNVFMDYHWSLFFSQQQNQRNKLADMVHK